MFFLALAMGVLSANSTAFAKDGMEEWMDRALRDIMVVHFYGAKEADSWRGVYWETIIPDDRDAKITVQPVVPYRQLGKSLRCDQFRTRSFHDWQTERTYDENGYPRGMALRTWMLPAYRKVTVSRKYWFFDDWPIFVSMAVFGDRFEMEHILNKQGNEISKETLYATHDLREYRSIQIEESYLYRRKIKVLTRKQCDGFRIFDFEVNNHG